MGLGPSTGGRLSPRLLHIVSLRVRLSVRTSVRLSLFATCGKRPRLSLSLFTFSQPRPPHPSHPSPTSIQRLVPAQHLDCLSSRFAASVPEDEIVMVYCDLLSPGGQRGSKPYADKRDSGVRILYGGGGAGFIFLIFFFWGGINGKQPLFGPPHSNSDCSTMDGHMGGSPRLMTPAILHRLLQCEKLRDLMPPPRPSLHCDKG